MKKRLSLSALLLIIACLTYAQSGPIDPTFNPTDQGYGFGDGAYGYIYSSAIQSDGKIIIAGSFSHYNGTERRNIARLNTDGTLDDTFDPGTGANSTISSIALQSDGKIVIGGSFSSYNGTSRSGIARLNADGTLDDTFDPGSGADDAVNALALQTDGKIVIGGRLTSYDGTNRNGIARLNADGSLDASFDPGSGINITMFGPYIAIVTISIQNDGKIIIGGNFFTYNGTNRECIARLNANGTLDASFNAGSGFTGGEDGETVVAIAIQSDGKLIIGGDFNAGGTSGIVRLNANGSFDSSFDPGTGIGTNQYHAVLAISILTDGKIIIGGYFLEYDGTVRNSVARLNADGSLDATFESLECGEYSVYTINLQSDGKIIIGGLVWSCTISLRNGVTRLNTDGTNDTTYNQGTGANDLVTSTAIQNDGKIIIAGYFDFFNGTRRDAIARLDADGSIDASFDPGTGANGGISALALQSDGKIIIGGNFTSYDGTGRNHFARINTDGSLDASFDPGSGTDSDVTAIAIQSDGKIIIGGQFTSYNGTNRNRIARLNTDGSIDNSFDPGTGADYDVYALAIQDDGNIIIGGQFTSYNGTTRNRIARLNTDGSLDNSFDPGTGADYDVYALAIQDDGNIIIGGQFTSYNGTSRNRIARLNTDGSLDNAFDPGTGADNDVKALAIQNDGKIVIGGYLSTYNGTDRSGIARLNADGSLDTSFDPGTGIVFDVVFWYEYGIYAISMQADGRIMLGGYFTSYDGTGRNRVARIIACSNFNNNENGAMCEGETYNWRGTDYSTSGVYYDSLSTVYGCDSVYQLTLTVNPLYSFIETFSICDGESYNWHGTDYTTAGIYYDSLTTVFGCDSIFELTLSVNPQYLFTESHSMCQSETYTWHDTDYTTSGVYYDSLTTVLGCDSIFELTLTANPFYSFLENHSICDGESYSWHGMNLTTEGIYYDSLSTVAGCDSIFELDLSVITIDTSVTLSGITITANLIADEYQWVDCDNAYSPIEGATSQSYTATENGNYAVIITMDLCSDTSVCTQITSVGVDNLLSKDRISVYPNPFSNQLTIELKTNKEERNFEILNSLGVIVFKGNIVNRTTIPTDKFPSGFYILKLENAYCYEVLRIIKKR